MTPSLQAHWRLDEASGNAIDVHGSNTLVDNATVTSNPGKIGSARQFTRANGEFLSIASNTALDLSGVFFTFSCWVYLDTNSANMGILGKDSATDRQYGLFYNSSGYFDFFVFDPGNSVHECITTITPPTTGAWYFIVCWYDGTALNISVNGGAADTLAYSSGLRSSSAPFEIGRVGGDSAGFGWNGRIDSVSAWKRILTATERTLLYASGSGLDYPLQLPGGATSSEALGTPTVSFTAGLTMQPPGIPSLQLAGLPRLQLTTSPAGVPSLDLPGTPRVQSGLRVAGLASLEALGVAKLNLRLVIPGISTQEIIGTPKVNTRIYLNGIASLEALGIPFIQVVRQIFPNGIASLQNLGTPKFNLRLYLIGIASVERLGTPFVNIPGTATTLFPAGIISLQNLGTPIVLRGSRTLLPLGIPTLELLGAVRLVRALRPGGIPSLQNLGTPRLNLRILVPGITSLETLGSLRLVRKVLPSGIVTLQAVGTPITTRGNKLQPLGILSLEKLGIVTVFRGAVLVRPTGIASNELLGLILVSSGFVLIKGTVTRTTLGRSTTTI